nr:small GTP binding protein Rab4 [Hymenolepis microstoma]
MTEIGFSVCGGSGGGFSPSGMESLLDSFWLDTPNFLEPPQLNFSDLKPISPGSTKSTSSLDSIFNGVNNTPPSSPWANEMVKDDLLQNTTSPLEKDVDLGNSINEFWEENIGSECRSSTTQSQIKKSTIIESDLLQEFGDSGDNSTVNMLEEQLASADNAWTVALELPNLAVEDVSDLLTETQKSSISPLPRQRRNKSKRRVWKKTMNYISSDSEATETGSECEEIECASSRNRTRMFIAGRMETVEDLVTSYDDADEPRSSPAKRRKISTSSSRFQTSTRHHPSSINFNEPWWPQRSGSIQQRLSSRDLDGCGSVGRSRRQMELWEFILRSLDAQQVNGSTKSAFKWVDRSLGIFRVTDTQKAAKEWGFYRGNARMDYEKMARAMRFYYKEYVLRKAHKQLHFQFSMPFVVWSKQQHSFENTSNTSTS